MKVFSLRSAGLLTGLALIVFFTATTPTLKADEWNLQTRIMSNHQIEVPGAVLEANTPYVMRLLDSPAERHVVQVFNENQDHLMSEFIAISAERTNPVDKPTFDFMEVPPGHPAPLQTWFHPGRRIGLEFLYPKDQLDKFAAYWSTYRAEQLAKATPVNTGTEAAAAPAVIEQEAAVIAPTVESAPVAQAPAPDVESTNAATEPVVSEPVQTAQNTDTTPIKTEPRELPRTAGELQLLGLFGALSMTLGALRIRR